MLAEASADDVGPELMARVALLAGRAFALNHRYSAALSVLFQTAEQVMDSDPLAALDMLCTCAVVAYHSGSEASREQVRQVLSAITATGPLGVRRAWTLAMIDPVADRTALLPELPRLAEAARGRPEELVAVATVAWLLDETPLALELFDDGLGRWRARGPVPEGFVCAAWSAYFEQGQWGMADDLARQASARTAVADLPEAAASALGMRASILAVRGETAAARELATEALTLIDPDKHTMLGVRSRWALGTAALADGDHNTAFECFRAMFTVHGEPAHYHASYPALADLAATAARIGRHDDAATALAAAEHALAGNPSPRLTALLHHGRALVAAEQDNAEHHYLASLGVPSAHRWPFERAKVLLDHGEWLRRRRRIVEARPQLTAALEVFRRLGARPWADRAQAELRAAGVGIAGSAPDPLDGLTAQQQQIIRLAARGLTNREIGERMFLSPRTVTSHLYRSFPKLGVTSRSQLRDLLARW
ncbi:helix-turn-helix domain-containing protein [Umezawaea tangerina]|uniref:Regulatory LuxR family protein n=1 Tax=Umezawaea tangerina TaxID=84725 RepID=A0A2T0T7R8_9PSEU|nr:helix-turn-helix transcriptional regulator [Umezawaea tangerina]PRY41678.1 regulatory LuxR family protein [Umezawaea tangerina]